ncbi:putative rRNA methyltransferase YqxC isoform X2 [Brassica rapa]|uniref:putative rRNA methyltransferase YqxC isoform X2 n=1 Tax=Brassica campestris TaxID=3711 RepID=UPI00142DD5D4|nr:putative rRNA methyltransferase YqxC isoform X2 [Brassica rapa]
MGFLHVLKCPISLRSYSSSLVGFFSKSHSPLLSARWVRAGDAASSIRCLASAIRGKNKKQRLDEACLERYQEYSRALIQSWILQGKVLVDGKRASKAGMPVANGVSIKITAEVPKYVCRGGLKLEAAIEKLDVDVSEKVVLDSGLSTGGFTDCLLRYGAAHVYGVDVGYGQVADKIRNDKRVTVIERTNLRYLPGLPQKVDVVTLDLSFISILKVMPAVMNVMNDDATLVTLVKPQFEARRSQVGRGGIVRDPEVHQEVFEKIINGIERYGFTNKGFIESPIKVADGNIKFLVRFDRGTVKDEEEEY